MRSAEKAAREAARLLANATQALRRARAKATRLKARGGCDAVAGRRRGRLARAVNDLTELLAATGQIARRPGNAWHGRDYPGRFDTAGEPRRHTPQGQTGPGPAKPSNDDEHSAAARVE
jgi:hypothetical protein